MADAASEQIIERIVLGNIAAGEMFTEYDVSVSARKQGLVLHLAEVRAIVEKLFASGVMGTTYLRTLVGVGTQSETYVYHRFSHSPHSHRAPTHEESPKAGGFFNKLIDLFLESINSLTSLTSSNSTTTTPTNSGGSTRGTPSRTFTSSTRSTASGPTSPPATPARRTNQTIDLDASQFLPVSRNELIRGAKGIRLFSNLWFGRRDLIPPIDDPRTLLIDRGMVTSGILSPDELAEIHRVGAAMDLHRPAAMLIDLKSQEAGRDAIDQMRAERARIKEQKKLDSQQRKVARQEAIRIRRANDIVFLGRRVSGKLGDRTSDATRLQQIGLPLLQSPADLASALQVSISQLRWLAFHAEVAERTHYVNFEVPKKSGGFRRLSSPHKKLAALQRWILEHILNKLPSHPSAHGFVSGRSILTNAQKHVDQLVVINMDLENFFPSITFPRVRRFFSSLGYSGAVSTILALLCTECPRRIVELNGVPFHVATGPRGLPQGACTSPAISNQVAVRLDRRLQGLATKMGLNYTRYADDLTFSGRESLSERVAYVMSRVRHFAEEEGYLVNHKKSRVQRPHRAQTVTGLVVNKRPTVSRKKIRQIRAILHRAKTEGLDQQNRHDHPQFRAMLQGYIAFIAMTRPEIASKFLAELEKL